MFKERTLINNSTYYDTDAKSKNTCFCFPVIPIFVTCGLYECAFTCMFSRKEAQLIKLNIDLIYKS